MNFHKVVDPPDLCEHWRCLNVGQERKVENALSLHPLETTFSILYWGILVHMTVDLWLSTGREVVLLT